MRPIWQSALAAVVVWLFVLALLASWPTDNHSAAGPGSEAPEDREAILETHDGYVERGLLEEHEPAVSMEALREYELRVDAGKMAPAR